MAVPSIERSPTQISTYGGLPQIGSCLPCVALPNANSRPSCDAREARLVGAFPEYHWPSPHLSGIGRHVLARYDEMPLVYILALKRHLWGRISLSSYLDFETRSLTKICRLLPAILPNAVV